MVGSIRRVRWVHWQRTKYTSCERHQSPHIDRATGLRISTSDNIHGSSTGVVNGPLPANKLLQGEHMLVGQYIELDETSTMPARQGKYTTSSSSKIPKYWQLCFLSRAVSFQWMLWTGRTGFFGVKTTTIGCCLCVPALSCATLYLDISLGTPKTGYCTRTHTIN